MRPACNKFLDVEAEVDDDEEEYDEDEEAEFGAGVSSRCFTSSL